MFKRVEEVLVGQTVILNGVDRKIKDLEPDLVDGLVISIIVTFTPLPGYPDFEVFPRKQLIEVVEDQSEDFKAGVAEGWRRHIEELEEEGFEAGRWWRAIKNGVMMAETSDPSDFKVLGLMDDPEVSFRRIYSRTESTWVMETPDV